MVNMSTKNSKRFYVVVKGFLLAILFFLVAPQIFVTNAFSLFDNIGKVTKDAVTYSSASVAIISPHQNDTVNPTESLQVVTTFDSNRISFTTDSSQRSISLGYIGTVELLVDGKSVAVKNIDFLEKKDTVTFEISLQEIGKISDEVTLQAQAYTKPYSFTYSGKGTLAAKSETVTVALQSFVGPEGGVVKGDEGVSVIIPSGALSEKTPVSISSNSFYSAVIPPQEYVSHLGSVILDLDNKTTNSIIDISIPAPTDMDQGPLQSDDQFLVTEEIFIQGERKMRLIDLAELENGMLTSKIISFPFPFPGIRTGGLFSIFSPLATKKPQNAVGYIKGTVRDMNGDPIQGAIVYVSKLYDFADLTDANGQYLIPSVVGSFAVTVSDPKTKSFQTKMGTIPAKGGGVTLDFMLKPSDITPNSEFMNPGFERGFEGWVTSGDTEIIPGLGKGNDGVVGTEDDVIRPREGKYMAYVGTGNGAVDEVRSSLVQSFIVPENAKKLVFEYNFVSEEFPEFKKSIYNDAFHATLTTSATTQEIAFEDVNNSETTPISGIDFPGADNTVEATGWKKKVIDLSGFGNPGMVTITISDAGDAAYDSVVLLDNFRILTDEDDEAFLQFPIKGYSAYTAPVTSILDHSGGSPYFRDKRVMAFTGEVAEGERYGSPDLCFKAEIQTQEGDDNLFCSRGRIPLFGYKRTIISNMGGINYAPPGGKGYFFYDGHPGYDYSFAKGTAVYAAAPGVVESKKPEIGQVDILHFNGYRTRYLHLDTYTVNVGDNVTENDIIGTVGSRGAVGNHLHFEVLYKSKMVDPYGWNGDVSGQYVRSGILWK